MLKCFDFLTQLLHLIEKIAWAPHATSQQALAQKHCVGHPLVHPTIVNSPACHNRQPATDDALLAVDRTLFDVPMRLPVFALTEMRDNLLNPLRINPRHPSCPKLVGFHQLHGHQPLVTLFKAEESRARENREETSRGTAVRFIFVIPNAELPWHTGNQAAVDGVIIKLPLLAERLQLQIPLAN